MADAAPTSSYINSTQKQKRFRVAALDDAVEDMSLFDRDRSPRKLITDDSMTTIRMRAFNKDVQCPVCWGILRDTRTVMVCMHRFCRDCIERSLQLGNVQFFANLLRRKRECPQCRALVPSRRSLRPDPNFDSLISMIYPNIDEVEEHEKKMIKKITEHGQIRSLLGNSISAGLARQAEAKSARLPRKPTSESLRRDSIRKRKKSHNEYEPALQKRRVDSTGQVADEWSDDDTLVAEEEVWFNMVRHQSMGPYELPYDKSYVRTCGYTRIADIIYYLAPLLGVDPGILELRVEVDGISIPLSHNMMLIAVIQNYWTKNQDLVLQYHSVVPLVGEPAPRPAALRYV